MSAIRSEAIKQAIVTNKTIFIDFTGNLPSILQIEKNAKRMGLVNNTNGNMQPVLIVMYRLRAEKTDLQLVITPYVF
jgi:hypothetical protein